MVGVIAAGVAFVACGSNKSSNSQHQVSGLKFRAFVSNSLFPNGVSNAPVINIIDATQNQLSPATIGLSGTVAQAGLMAVSPSLSLTLVFSQADNTIAVISNTSESVGASSNGGPGASTFVLPGSTESMFVAKDNLTVYAAVPSAPVTGQSPGAVVVMNLGTGAISATIPVAGARFVVPSPDGNHVLVFSDKSDAITVISTVLIGTSQDPRAVVAGTAQNHFDRPVWAIFSDSGSAYIFNCGKQCGGTAAGISTFTIGDSGPGSTTPVSGATYGLLNGTTLYVAGTPPHTACGSGTAAPTCGTLNILDVGSMEVTNSKPIVITDGYHDRMEMGSNGQLFIGSHSCSNVNVAGGEVRGCLSIFNTTNSKVVIPPQIGDATGMQAVPGRNIVYICQGGAFQIFDTTTDKLLVQNVAIPLVIVGQAVDVKIVDPPPD
ncbi:MAG: hypothetical protein WB952_08450 [Terriglobales bacterium]